MQSMFCSPVCGAELHDLISKSKVVKSFGPAIIEPRIIKEVVHINYRLLNKLENIEFCISN
jgi:hypothetical protein